MPVFVALVDFSVFDCVYNLLQTCHMTLTVKIARLKSFSKKHKYYLNVGQMLKF